MKKILGALMLLLAVALIGWLVYVLAIEVPKPGQKQEAPYPAFAFVAGLIYVGQKWLRGPEVTNEVYEPKAE